MDAEEVDGLGPARAPQALAEVIEVGLGDL